MEANNNVRVALSLYALGQLRFLIPGYFVFFFLHVSEALTGCCVIVVAMQHNCCVPCSGKTIFIAELEPPQSLLASFGVWPILIVNFVNVL